MSSVRGSHKIGTAAAAVLLLAFILLPVAAGAVNDEGLLVERLTFRDVLRIYTLDRPSFGADALEQDAAGVTNAAKRLAEMFAYTVGLNYTGEGKNVNFFGKDITNEMKTGVYKDDKLLATYQVEIRPHRSYALALPEGETTALRVYLVGYESAGSGVEPILHYVWEENGRWFAVKDDNPYYKVSYNGLSARQLSGTGLVMTRSRAASGGTGTLQEWTNLSDAADADGVVHLDGGTLVAGEGRVNVFGVTRDADRLRTEGNYSVSLLAVSDYVLGDTNVKTGPLVFQRDIYEADTMRRVADGEALKEGLTYRFRVVYDEALSVADGADWTSVGIKARAEATGMAGNISGFVWYGNEEYLTGDRYDPHTVEFNYTPSTEGCGIVTYSLVNLVGSTSAMKAADFHARTETSSAAPAAENPPASTPTAAADTPADSTPAAAPVSTPAPTAMAVPMTPKATLAVLFNATDTAPLTRGVLAQTLWILAGQPEGENEALYSDLPTDREYAQAVLWAGRTGIIDAHDGVFGVDASMTREETAAALYRYAAMRGKNTQTAGDIGTWSDGITVDPQAAEAVLWAVERGLMTALPDGGLHPRDTMLCGEAIRMIATLQQRL